MALKRVDLFDLAAIRETDILDAEVALRVVGVRRDLSPVRGDDVYVREQAGRAGRLSALTRSRRSFNEGSESCCCYEKTHDGR